MLSPEQIANRLRFARSVSYFGSAFSDFTLPLFIYETTKSPMLLGFQWTLNALFRLFAGRMAGRLQLWRKDQAGLIGLDVLQFFASLFPLAFWNTSPALGTYLSGILLAVFITIQAGYIDSIVRNTASLSQSPAKLRTWLNAKLENGRNWGLFLGYAAAWATATYAGFKFAILLDAATFLLSAAITMTIRNSHSYEGTKPPIASYSLLFKNREIALLTLSQASLSFAIYIFNAGYIFTMKSHFSAPDSAIAALLIAQAFCYILGTQAASKYPILTLKQHALIRWVFVVVFIGFAASAHATEFIFWNAILSLVISFTQPGILSFFQSHATVQTSRALGSARTSTMAVTGSFGAALSGYLLQTHSHSIVFTIGTLAAILGASLFTVLGGRT